MIRAESLFDGTLDLEQVAALNDALDVMDENERRALDQARKGR